jgi:hypothetical protein
MFSKILRRFSTASSKSKIDKVPSLKEFIGSQASDHIETESEMGGDHFKTYLQNQV